MSEDPDRALLFRLETQTIEIIQRDYYFAQKIAQEIVCEVEASIENPVLLEELAAL